MCGNLVIEFEMCACNVDRTPGVPVKFSAVVGGLSYIKGYTQGMLIFYKLCNNVQVRGCL